MFVDRDTPEKYQPEYDVKVRRLAQVLALTSPGKEAMGAAISKFQPGETVREHVNKPGVEEIFILMRGDVAVRLAGAEEIMHQGDVTYAARDESHAFTNVGDTNAELLSIWWRVVESKNNFEQEK